MEVPLPQATHVVMGRPITGEYALSPQPQAPVTSREIGIPLADLGRRDQGKGTKSWRAEQQGQTPGVRTLQRGSTAKEPSASASYCRVTNSPTIQQLQTATVCSLTCHMSFWNLAGA